ncbi:MAG: hypothetical protein ACOYUK_04030 [Patescibacteria group bacterium]
MTTVRGRPLWLVVIRWVMIACAIIIVWFSPSLAVACALIGIGLPMILSPSRRR